jgi:glutamyl-tRNA synthetase
MILGSDGQKLSKRHGAVSVMQYHQDGYLPEAILNYLARLGWSHGDDEIFDMDQFCEWFDLDHITPSAAQFNTEKLNWLNAHYIKTADLSLLAKDISIRLAEQHIAVQTAPAIMNVLELYRERANNLNQLATDVAYFYQRPQANIADIEKHITDDVKPAIQSLYHALSHIDWVAEQIHEAINMVVKENQLKFPKLAMPLRVMLAGTAQSPSIDQVMVILGKEEVLARIQPYLQ